jgi:membrane associated rhomboid family serine protease
VEIRDWGFEIRDCRYRDCDPIPNSQSPIPISGVVLALWFGLQLLSNTMAQAGQGGVAFRAHIGGFIAGMLLVALFKKRDVRLFEPAR